MDPRFIEQMQRDLAAGKTTVNAMRRDLYPKGEQLLTFRDYLGDTSIYWTFRLRGEMRPIVGRVIQWKYDLDGHLLEVMIDTEAKANKIVELNWENVLLVWKTAQ